MGFMRRTKQNEFPPGTLDMLILQVLTHQPMHGYGIAQFLRRRTEDVLQVGEGSLYPALQRLQVQGLLAAGWRQSDTGRRAKYYRLTSLGRAYLEAERESYGRVSGAIARVLQEV
jgi:transcriptional regulator